MTDIKDIKIELAHIKIIKFSAETNIGQNTDLQIEASYSAEVYDPKDALDPTAMVLATCSMNDSNSKQLAVNCTAELYFKFDPIPEDRSKAIREISRDTIQNELNKRIRNLLREMGHNLTIK